MHPEIEPDNWMELLQAITFMADPDADQDDPLAWANAHEYRLELWADALQRMAQLNREGPPPGWNPGSEAEDGQ